MAFKYSKDDSIFNEVINSVGSKKVNKNTDSNYSSYNDDDFLNQIDFYSNNIAKKNLEVQQQKEEKLKEEKKKTEEYYNKNKDSLIKERTNSLIYNWDLEASGGTKYDYNGSKDTNYSDFYTNLGVNDLSLNNFLIADEEAENKKKSKQWQTQKEVRDKFKELSPLNQQSSNNNLYFDSTFSNRSSTNDVNPYENKDSYYKKYIEKFNTSIKEGNVKAANNALQKINEKYFGADYSDGMLRSLFSDEKDQRFLEKRFDTNVQKLEAINNSIANGTDDITLTKLQTEKSKLEFENQLIQYNRLTTIYSLNNDYNTIENMYSKIEDPFKNIDVNLEWNKDKKFHENIIDNFANLTNGVIQTVGATSNAIMESSFGSITTLLTNDIEDEKARTFTAGLIDFAEYLVPYVGQAKLYIDTASTGSIALPGLYDNLVAKPLGLEEQSSAFLGENPNELQTLGASIYIAMNFVLDGIIKNSPLGKFSFDGKTQQEISKMTFGNILKSLGITSLSEGTEEFIQAYGEDMMYGDRDRSLTEVLTNKETFASAFRNFIYAAIVSGAVGTTQVGTSKLKYHNTITTDTKYAHVNDSALEGVNVDATNVEKVDNEKLTETLITALENNKSVDIISTDIDNDITDLDIEYTSPINNTSKETTSATTINNDNTYKSNVEAITFDSTEKTILESLNNPNYYEAKGLSESPTLNEIYELLVSNNDPMAEKLFYYDELYGNKKYSTFVENLNNGKITPEIVATQTIPENTKSTYGPNAIKNNTVTTVVPSQEMANFILAKNPTADVEVIDIKSPTFNEDVKNYVNGKATYNLNLNTKIKNEKSPTTVDSKIVKNLHTELNDLNNTLSKVEANTDLPISKVKIDNSALANGNFVDISNNVQENLLNTLDTENYSIAERREAFAKTLSILNKYNNEVRTPIKQKGGKPIVFDKTGFNTYEASESISTDGHTPVIVNSTGKFIYGNSDAKLNLSERAVNKINNMIDKLGLNGDKLTTRSTNKDVAELVNKNKDMAKEILQTLGYDGILYGKQKTKLITATDNNDTANINNELNNTTKKINEIMAAEKEGSDKESFIAKMQIARETLNGSVKTKPVKVGSKQLDSTNSSIKVNSDLNLSNKSITEAKLDSAGSAIKNNKLLNFDTDLNEVEQYAVEKWRGADSYKVQDRLRRGEFPSKLGIVNGVNQSQIIKGVDSVLKKAPTLNGAFNRSLVFDTKEEMIAFANKFKEGKTTIEKGYMSAAKTGIYKMEGLDGKNPDIIIQIKSNNAKDVSNIMRPDEVEVMFGRNTKLKTIQKIDDGKGHIYIQAEDVTNNVSPIKPTPIKSEVTVKAGDIEIKGNPEMISVDTLQDIEAAFNEVSVHNTKANKELKKSFSKVYSAIFDRYSPILNIANENSNLDVKNAISDLWTIRNKVHNNVKVEQTDINGNVVGKSLDAIKKQIKKQDLNDFQKTIRAILNVERINNDQERVLNLDAKKSQQYYDSMIKKHPYFKNVIDDLRTWNTNNTQKLYDAGLITMKQKEALDSKYTIYAPIYSAEPSDFGDIGEKSYNTKLKASDTLKPTTKQGKSILDIWTAFVAQEQNLENSILKNNAYKAMANSKLYSIDAKGKNAGTDIIYYDGGKVNKFTTNNEIAQVFQKYNIEKTLDDIFSIPALNWFPKLKTKVQQKMLTSYDPIYTANNMLRDFGDSALFYSKYPLKFAKNYIRAAYNAANNSVLYQEITNTGIVPKTASTNKFTRILTSIESLPKIAEYMSAIESGKTSVEAKLEAQDVNLNFARGGYATQALNSKGWLFLNASTQALDKTVSTIKYDIGKIKENPVKGSLNLLMKVGAMSAPAMLNALLNQDDEDYEKLPYYYKNNYYMIKIGDNKFLRIPKGRIVGTVDTLVRYATGVDDEVDLNTYIESIKSSLETSVLPQDLIESSPFGEITAIKNNKNYYGAEIYDEGAPLDEKAFSIINYISMNIFGRYGKAFKNLMDGDSTTDIVDVNSYVFDSTKYDKNLSSIYTLRDKYQYQKKNDKDMSFEDKVMKKYIDTKVYAINSINGDINKQKANGATLEDMKDLYQARDALTQDTIDNYNKYTIDKNGDVWTIYFDDETYTYTPSKDSFKKLKK